MWGCGVIDYWSQLSVTAPTCLGYFKAEHIVWRCLLLKNSLDSIFLLFAGATVSGFMSSRLTQIQDHLTPNMAVVFDENVPDINLYTTQTPNGIKISITLEELGCARLRIILKEKPLIAAQAIL